MTGTQPRNRGRDGAWRAGVGVAAGVVVVVLLTVATRTGTAPVGERAGGVAAADLRADVVSYLEAADPSGQVRAVLVEVDGERVLEYYVGADEDEFFDVRSVTASVVSAAVGIAISEGRIDGVDQTLAELLPDRAGSMRPEVAGVTLEQVLTHTGGFPGDDAAGTDWWRHADRVGAVLASGRGPEEPPRFAYSSGGSHLVAAVLAEATGEPVLDYVGEKVLDPLGVPRRRAFEPVVTPDLGEAEMDRLYDEYMATGFAWSRDPQGVHEGGCCMRLRPADLLALGRLYLDDGRVGGIEVVPAGWVEASTRRHVAATRGALPGYGYQWWTTEAGAHSAFVAYGHGGQMVEVVPDLGLVVVVVTEIDDRDPRQLLTLFGPGEATFLVELALLPHLCPRT